MNWLRRLFLGTIPRDMHDQIVNDLREQLRDERTRTRKLMRTVIRMKVTGGTIPRALPGVRLTPKEPTDIDQALDDNPRTRSDMKLRARHRVWADREIAKHPTDENHRAAVLAKLRTFAVVTSSDDDDDDDEDDDGDVIAITTEKREARR